MDWLNEHSRTFLKRDYLLEGTTPEQRIKDIAKTAERILNIEGFANKFESYMAKGWYSLATPIWLNFGLERGLPISCFGIDIQDDTADILRAVAEIGMMTKHGGGTAGFFGKLRHRGAPIKNNGLSNGSVSFLEPFQTITDVVTQGCYDNITEILTNNGWKLFKDLNKEDLVAQVTDDDIVEFVKPLNYFEYEVDEKLELYKDSKNINLLVTSNHNMVFKRMVRVNSKKENGKYIDNKKKVKNEFYISESKDCPLNRNIKFQHSSFLKEGVKKLTDFERLLIAFQADGSFVENSKKSIRFHISKSRKIENLEKILNNLSLEFNKETYTEGKSYVYYISIDSGKLSKIFDWVDISNISLQWGLDFIKELSKWNSSVPHYNSIEYSSINKYNVDVVQSIAAVTGYKSKISVKNKRKGNRKDLHVIYLSKGELFGVERLEKAYVDYKGYVYCVEVPSNKIIVRRKGHSLVCGNSARRGYFAAYLPIEHRDINEFLRCRDEGNIIQDINTAVCISDKFMEEMIEGDYEKRKIWAKVLQKRAETGMPYIFFTDNINKGKPKVYKDKNMMINHSQLCSEIIEYTDEYKSFVCCLSSMNLLHYHDWKNTDAVETLTFFLDAVYTEFINKAQHIPFMEKAVRFAREHRSIGIGVLGWHSFLQSQMIPFEGMNAKYMNAEIFELIDNKTLKASKQLAKMFGEPLILKGYGERFTTRVAPAPTTSSSFILGQVSPSIEPLKSNYFVKDLAKGKFVYKNPYLKKVLKELGKDTVDVWQSILIKGGSVQHLDFLDQLKKDVFKTASEISQLEIIQQAAQRQKYIDQSQSLNLFIHPDTPLKEINALYIEAWRLGVKTLYYQRSVNLAQQTSRELMECSTCEG